MLTAVQKEILQSLINLYRKSKCTSVKCESIADVMGRNSGTIRNQMQSLRSLGLVQGVPGPRGGYKPTLEAYHALNIENDPCEIHVPIYVNKELVSDISVNKIEFTSILRPGDCEATISVLGDIKQLDLDDTIKIGPTPVNNLTVSGTIIGRDDVDNVLLIKTKNIQSIPNIKIKEIAVPLTDKVAPNTSVYEVSKLLLNDNIRGVPVVDGDEILGVIRYPDILSVVAEKKLDSTAEEFMDETVVTAKDNISLINAMDLLQQNNVSSLVLLNEKSDISGIVSFTDILHRLVVFDD
ncbi:CBS domain-containing protein [Candidatus Methanosphaera massiliense]|jgi:predicted transcriptional regulator|uniref:CBS domain-containing protein n=1 Tax=Methanosphaera TaxID=2316 RepID=UPI00238017F6|nr:CBS domain-containing protein [Candidatus Methanosphaera massiliense]MDD6285136.1 CBS domain-containing protein [Methanobacteriaceae archaeon]MDE4078349.1 CBS domain-containing protein [Candidatus Methanosphaera massiliense]MDY2744455.1 CBS domain-containing protein [Methanosphaera sp.]